MSADRKEKNQQRAALLRSFMAQNVVHVMREAVIVEAALSRASA